GFVRSFDVRRLAQGGWWGRGFPPPPHPPYPPHEPYFFTSSTLLFCAFPPSVLLSATGLVSPNPAVVRRSGAMEKFATRYCLTAAARASESVLLEAGVPTLSVCP